MILALQRDIAMKLKFISVRDLRNRPGQVWDRLCKEDVVFTSNGKPVGILIGVEEEDLGKTTELLRRVRAQMAVSRMRRDAARGGTGGLSAEEIEDEIGAVRSERTSG